MEPQPQRPVVLHSEDGVARIIAISLPAGDALDEHQVHEHAWLHVHRGAVEVSADERPSARRQARSSTGSPASAMPSARSTTRCSC